MAFSQRSVVAALCSVASAHAQCNTWIPSGTAFENGSSVSAAAVLTTGDLVVAGDMTTINGVVVNRIARWTGTTWVPLGTGLDSGAIELEPLPNGGLAVGGFFSNAGGVPASRIAIWNGSSWSSLGTGINAGPFTRVEAIQRLSTGDIIVGGSFSSAGGVPAANIARWNGTAWSALGSGVTGGSFPQVSTLAVLNNGQLVAGGAFTTAGGVAANRIARWNGTSWAALGTGVNNAVNDLAVRPNGDLIAVGGFTSAGGTPANGIARWNGLTWAALATGSGAFPTSVVVLPDASLVVGGLFSSLSGVSASNIARLTGSTWSALGAGLNSDVSAIAVLPSGDLAVGGLFTQAGGQTSRAFAEYRFGRPFITSSPINAITCPGGTVILPVTAEGPGTLTYSWTSNGQPISPLTNPSAATSQLSIAPTATAIYVCTVANACGSAASLPATIEVLSSNDPLCGPLCDSIDFNNDNSLFDPTDIAALLSVYAEGPCIPASATCNDIDFNNDSSLFDPCDIASFLLVYAEGPCTPCGQ